MVRIFSVVFAATLFAGAGAAIACPGHKGKVAEAKTDEGTIGYVGVDELAAWHEKKAAVIIDANKKETFEAGHIPGATHVRYDAVTAKVLGADKDAKLVFYCANEMCGASRKAAKKALELGYTNVYVYKGGIEGWKKAGKPVAQAKKAAKDVKG